MKILVTGCAGFIGMHVAEILLKRGDNVLGVDNINSYYSVRLKHLRLEQLKKYKNFSFYEGDIADKFFVVNLFDKEKPERVINLAAQAGVRYSIENPHAYIQANIVGFGNILESCRRNNISHLVYASSSSVYGSNTKMPFSVHDNVDHPVSLYAASKKANELMAHSYSHLFELPTTGLRYFTVYGPWGRPDMSPWLFTSAILERRPINVFNFGKMQRDFTYITDIAEGTVRVLDRPPVRNYTLNNQKDRVISGYYKIYNIGNHQPIELMEFINKIERSLGFDAIKNFLPMQPGDVPATYADVDDLRRDIGFEPNTSLDVGIEKWTHWYKSYINN